MRQWQTKSDNTAPNSTGILTAGEDNARGIEENNLVTSAGLTLESTNGPDVNLKMMAEAVARYAAGGGFVYADTGAANVYVLAGVLGTNYFVMPKAYFTGMKVGFCPGNTNTSTTTLNVSGLGAKKLFTHTGAVCAGGELVANRFAEAIYDASLDGGAGAFKLFPWSNQLNIGGGGGGGGGSVLDGEGIDIDGSDHVNLNFPGLTAGTPPPANADLFAYYDSVAGHHKSLTYAQLTTLFSAGGGRVTKNQIGMIAVSVNSGGTVTNQVWYPTAYISGDGVLDPNQAALGGQGGPVFVYDTQRLTGISVTVVAASTTGCTFDVAFTSSSFAAASDYRVTFNDTNSGGAINTYGISNKTASGFRATFTYIGGFASMNFYFPIYA